MGRRVWIIDENEEITDKVKADAKLNNCPEIVVGIPQALNDQIGALPSVYEEPDPIPPDKPRDLAKEIDALKIRLSVLESKP